MLFESCSDDFNPKWDFPLHLQEKTLISQISVILFLLFTTHSMQYQGFVKFIGPRETIGEGVEKQTIVLEENTDREFKGSIAVDFFRDKINLLSDVNTGDLITVHLNARANESRNQPGRWFNSITCRRVEKSSTAPANSSDDLPF